MSIKLTRNIIVNKEYRKIGDVIDLHDQEAKILIADNSAVKHEPHNETKRKGRDE